MIEESNSSINERKILSLPPPPSYPNPRGPEGFKLVTLADLRQENLPPSFVLRRWRRLLYIHIAFTSLTFHSWSILNFACLLLSASAKLYYSYHHEYIKRRSPRSHEHLDLSVDIFSPDFYYVLIRRIFSSYRERERERERSVHKGGRFRGERTKPNENI